MRKTLIEKKTEKSAESPNMETGKAKAPTGSYSGLSEFVNQRIAYFKS